MLDYFPNCLRCGFGFPYTELSRREHATPPPFCAACLLDPFPPIHTGWFRVEWFRDLAAKL